MEFESARCTTCGGSINIDINKEVWRCNYCGNTFLVKQAIDLSSKREDEIKSIEKLNTNLIRSVNANKIESIIEFSHKILAIMPEDYKARYFNAYAFSKKQSLKIIKNFYSDLDISATKEDRHLVADHIIENFDVRYYGFVHNYISKFIPDKTAELEKQYKLKLDLEENYSNVHRDVFICYSSIDEAIAKKVLNKLEDDGNSCWVSFRNLRPNDSQDYWENIHEAIRNCDIFLVLSSHQSMFSKDVQKEISIANKLNKKRIELKLDASKHTTLFKQFFDGYKWIESSQDFEKSLNLLLNRVYKLKSDLSLTNKDFGSIKEQEVLATKSLSDGLTQKESLINLKNDTTINPETHRPSSRSVPLDKLKKKYQEINFDEISNGFRKALEELYLKEEEFNKSYEIYNRTEANEIDSLQWRINRLSNRIRDSKDLVEIKTFDSEEEIKRKKELNENIRLENRDIEYNNLRIEDKIHDLEYEIEKIQNHAPTLENPTIEKLLSFDLSDAEREEIRFLKAYNLEKLNKIRNLKDTERNIERTLHSIRVDRDSQKMFHIMPEFNHKYPDFSLTWIFKKDKLSKLNNYLLERQIYNNSLEIIVITASLSFLAFMAMIFSIVYSETIFIIVFAILSFTAMGLFGILSERLMNRLRRLLTSELEADYNAETKRLLEEKKSLLEEENKDILLSEAVESNYDLDRVNALSTLSLGAAK